MKLIVKRLNNLDVSSGKAFKLLAKQVHTGKRHINLSENNLSWSDKVVYGRGELDYHADTTAAGSNFCILQYTGK